MPTLLSTIKQETNNDYFILNQSHSAKNPHQLELQMKKMGNSIQQLQKITKFGVDPQNDSINIRKGKSDLNILHENNRDGSYYEDSEIKKRNPMELESPGVRTMMG